MAKRIKKTQKGVESLISEIEKHFLKLETDIKERNLERGRYHFKEIDRSLLKALEIKLEILKANKSVLERYRKKLQELKEKLF